MKSCVLQIQISNSGKRISGVPTQSPPSGGENDFLASCPSVTLEVLASSFGGAMVLLLAVSPYVEMESVLLPSLGVARITGPVAAEEEDGDGCCSEASTR